MGKSSADVDRNRILVDIVLTKLTIQKIEQKNLLYASKRAASQTLKKV